MTTTPVTRPSDSQLNRAIVDAFGLTHPGRVRSENEDQFLIASLHKQMQVHQTSLPADPAILTSPARGYVFLVADGLGGRPAGALASETALQAIAEYVTNAMDLPARRSAEAEDAVLARMQRSVERSHEVVRAEAALDDESAGMATTLTMVMVFWPHAYLVHVGDSRCYRLRKGQLEQLTKDQTMAQYMLDAGVMSAEQAEQSRLKHVLWSALGGRELTPEAMTGEVEWDDVMLLCTDGLTKHVTDGEIRDCLIQPASTESMCRTLVDLALERGGSDNVTVVIGRPLQR
jgi:serine/threonine protein phosphatase PrpC